jgi:Phage tail assembly chaperone protein
MNDIDYLVIKLTSEDGSGVPIGVVESPPMLWLTLKERNPGFSWSFPPVASEVEPFGYGLFEWTIPPQNLPYDKHYTANGVTKDTDNVWKNTYTTIDATPEQITERTNLKTTQVKLERDRALKKSDFIFAPDVPEAIKNNLDAWKTYRQSLRDLPSQAGFPWNITFPEKPSN